MTYRLHFDDEHSPRLETFASEEEARRWAEKNEPRRKFRILGESPQPGAGSVNR
jgi:hypothetical protein